MSKSTKRILVIGGILLLAILVIGGTLVVVPRLAEREKAVAPTAPVSVPRAAEWITAPSCNTTFALALGPTPTPTPTVQPIPTPTPTPGPTPTPTPTPGPLTPQPTPTPTPPGIPVGFAQPTPTPTPTPTPPVLPEAGISLLTLGALGGGIIMILLGILLAL